MVISNDIRFSTVTYKKNMQIGEFLGEIESLYSKSEEANGAQNNTEPIYSKLLIRKRFTMADIVSPIETSF